MGHTVLVCDDAIFMRTMISDILAQAGFEIVGEAETGTQAVEKYRQLKPDLVTMDIVMPDMGGIDALVHVAAGTRGSEDVQFASTVVATEHLLEAMSRSPVRPKGPARRS